MMAGGGWINLESNASVKVQRKEGRRHSRN